MKPCRICLKNKNLSEFGKASNTKDGLKYECKDCIRDINKERWSNGRSLYNTNRKTKDKKRKRNVVVKFHGQYLTQLAKNRGFSDMQLRQYPDILETIKLIIKGKRLCKSKTQNN